MEAKEIKKKEAQRMKEGEAFDPTKYMQEWRKRKADHYRDYQRNYRRAYRARQKEQSDET